MRTDGDVTTNYKLHF